MQKEYITARLFRHNREADDLITEEEEKAHDSDQQQSTEAPNKSLQKKETVESHANPHKSSLPQRLLSGIQRTLEVLGLDHKD